MKTRRLRIVAALVAICLGIAVGQPAPAHAQGINVLILGPSLVRGIKSNLKKFLRDAGYPRPKIVAMGVAGATLTHHATANRTRRNLDRRQWDFVVMANSAKQFNVLDYPGARDLHDKVVARGAQPVFLMTWLPRLVSILDWDLLLGEPGGSTGYIPIATELGAPIAPCGWAVRQVKLDADPVDLWKRSTHLSPRGRYLVSAVVYATITGDSPIGLRAPASYVREGTADYLQAVAETIVFSDPGAWNLSFD